MKLLIISHGDFAAGITSTLKTFFQIENVYSACVTQEGGTGDLLDKVHGYLDQWGDELVVICSDLKGGSANQAVLPLLERPNTFLISGMNLSLLLQLGMEPEVTAEGIREMLEAAKEDMTFINDMALGQMDEDDE
ncbi:PTS sugar transporter subunit IIA [Laedolimicola intestinihominis]|uniref:PTS EIIA type-4 domain-containing protein n=1 Tax=Laedolimicola intestinihominis TaxID=3133166 RepID=A0ABV1FKT3_9FIRM